ncbi:MAG: type II toxin-antitoxin system RelE/ParE family toxin [Chloroflexi bacterium]|nr:type II toxin-antitoxin system RelE/ParE family toxin [Chloroflexota bacterium]
MARIRWSSLAAGDLEALLDWLATHRGPGTAASAYELVEEAVARIAVHPELYAWVGSIHESVAELPRTVRRVVIARYGLILFYEWRPELDEIRIVRLRGGRQRPPSSQDLAPRE